MESKNRLKDFQIQKKLGFGSYGVIFRVMRRLDKKVLVLKQIDLRNMKEKMRKNAINEAILLAKLKSPFIVEYLESFIEDNRLNIIMEHCEGGDLSLFLKQQNGRPLKQDKIWELMLQIIMGLEHIHRKRILHRDIKTLNIFLTRDQRVKIGDLGVAKMLDSADFAQTMVGTPFYLSPELCEEKPYNQKSDVWALGCLIYEMCTYRHPFEAANQGSLILKIIRGKYTPISANYSKELRDIIESCLERDYKRRPTAALILSRVYCQQKIETLGLKMLCQQFVAQQEKKNFTEQLKVKLEQPPGKELVQSQKKDEDQRKLKQQQQKKLKQAQRKRKEDQKKLRQDAQKREDQRRQQEKKEQLRRVEEKTREQERRKEEDRRKEEIRREQRRRQESRREELRKQSASSEDVKKQAELKRQVARQEQLKKEEERRQQLKRANIKKDQARKQQLRKQQLRKQQLRKQQLRKQQLRKEELSAKQQPKRQEQLVQKTPVRKVKAEKEVAPRVYDKVDRSSNKPKQTQTPKPQVKAFVPKPVVPVPKTVINNLRKRSNSKNSIGNVFEDKPIDRYFKKQQKIAVHNSNQLPPRVRRGVPEGKARNAMNPSRQNLSKQQQQLVLDLPDDPKGKTVESSDQEVPDSASRGEGGIASFQLKNSIDDEQILRKYEQLVDQSPRQCQTNYISEGPKQEQDDKQNLQQSKLQADQVDLQKRLGHRSQELSLEDSLQKSTQFRQQSQKDNTQRQEPSFEQDQHQQPDQDFNFHQDQPDQQQEQQEEHQVLQDVNLWAFDQEPEMPAFEQNDDVLMEQEQQEEAKPELEQNSRAHLQLKLESNIKREDQLNKLMQLKIDQCKKAFKGNYQEVIEFFRKKINMDSEYGEDDEKEIDLFLKKKGLTNNNKFQNIYKIMHFEMELENCRGIIQGICRKLNSLTR